MSRQKILVITYYWPPSGGSGVQRWLKFVKYLPQLGWEPHVFTPENPSGTIQDESLFKDVPSEVKVVKLPIWEPYEVFGKLSKIFGGKKAAQPGFVNTKQTSLFSKISIWARGNLFIPDPRKFWINPATRFLETYLKQNQIDTIVTTGPPHSMHLIGLRLKKRNPALRWIVDMRDPWSEWGFLDSIKAGNRARVKHRALEHQVLTTADEVLTITPFYVRQFERLSGRKVNLITNGFDEDDFKDFKLVRSDKFRLRHIGIVNEKCDPRPFMSVVKNLCLSNHDIRNNIEVEFVGTVNNVFREFIVNDPVLSSVTKLTASVPHKEVKGIYASSAVLLLILTGYKDAEGYMPGKMFEYLVTGLPILGVGPTDGDAATLLNLSKAGTMFEEDATQEIEGFIKTAYDRWKNSQSANVPNNASAYSRKALTVQLVELLNTKS